MTRKWYSVISVSNNRRWINKQCWLEKRLDIRGLHTGRVQSWGHKNRILYIWGHWPTWWCWRLFRTDSRMVFAGDHKANHKYCNCKMYGSILFRLNKHTCLEDTAKKKLLSYSIHVRDACFMWWNWMNTWQQIDQKCILLISGVIQAIM